MTVAPGFCDGQGECIIKIDKELCEMGKWSNWTSCTVPAKYSRQKDMVDLKAYAIISETKKYAPLSTVKLLLGEIGQTATLHPKTIHNGNHTYCSWEGYLEMPVERLKALGYLEDPDNFKPRRKNSILKVMSGKFTVHLSSGDVDEAKDPNEEEVIPATLAQDILDRRKNTKPEFRYISRSEIKLGKKLKAFKLFSAMNAELIVKGHSWGKIFAVSMHKHIGDSGTYKENVDRMIGISAVTGVYSHENILSFLGYVNNPPAIFLWEWAGLGCLDQFLIFHETKLSLRFKFGKDIASGLEYLSGKKFVFGDVACRNVLVCENHTCKLQNLDLATRIEDGVMYYTSKSGKTLFRWTPPEAVRSSALTTESDAWQFGLLLYELWTAVTVPYSDRWESEEIMKDTRDHLRDGNLLPEPEHCPGELYDTIAKCWEVYPKDRPNFTSLKDRLGYLESRDFDKYGPENKASPDDLYWVRPGLRKNKVLTAGIVTDAELQQYLIEAGEPLDGPCALLAFELDVPNSSLMVSACVAENLKSMDWGGTSDPYLKIQIRPSSRHQKAQKTKVQKKTLSPEWKEKFIFQLSGEQIELPEACVDVQIWDWDFGINLDDFMCQTKVSVGQINSADYQRLVKWFPMSEERNKDSLKSEPVEDTDKDKYLALAGSPPEGPSLLLAVELDLLEMRLFVSACKGNSLPIKDKRRGTSDPYLKLSLYPSVKGHKKRSTKVKKKTLKPEWWEKFQFMLSPGHIEEDGDARLVIECWDWDFGLDKDDFMGELSIVIREAYLAKDNLLALWWPLGLEKNSYREKAVAKTEVKEETIKNTDTETDGAGVIGELIRQDVQGASLENHPRGQNVINKFRDINSSIDTFIDAHSDVANLADEARRLGVEDIESIDKNADLVDLAHRTRREEANRLRSAGLFQQATVEHLTEFFKKYDKSVHLTEIEDLANTYLGREEELARILKMEYGGGAIALKI
eukprot:UC4_evm3s328